MSDDSDKVVHLPHHTTYSDVPPGRILDVASRARLQEVVIIGHTEAGAFYFASSQADGGDALWLLERAKHKLMQQADELEEG